MNIQKQAAVHWAEKPQEPLALPISDHTGIIIWYDALVRAQKFLTTGVAMCRTLLLRLYKFGAFQVKEETWIINSIEGLKFESANATGVYLTQWSQEFPRGSRKTKALAWTNRIRTEKSTI